MCLPVKFNFGMAKVTKKAKGKTSSTKCESLDLFKFPRTRHLVDAGGSAITRDDLLMTKKEAKDFLTGKIITVEEKIDGANIGFSVDENYTIRAQNRAHFVSSNSHKQFSTLDTWISQNSEALLRVLNNGQFILFGEWMYAKHSIYYTSLPSYFIAFDIYNSHNGTFVSKRERDRMLEGTGIHVVPLVVEREFRDIHELLPYLETKSAYYDGPVEGLYLRKDSDSQQPNTQESQGNVLFDRSKVVRPDFLQQIDEQWTKQKFTKNVCDHY